MSISIKKFFDSDLADEVRNLYIDALRRGKESCDVTKQLIFDFEAALLDDDDAPIFWFTLADVQWDMGRLDELVKQNALVHIDKELQIQKSLEKTIALTGLRDKLSSPQPVMKKVKQYRFYHTDWKIGDVFAYCLDCDAADYPDYHNMYMYFVVKGMSQSCYRKAESFCLRTGHTKHIILTISAFRFLVMYSMKWVKLSPSKRYGNYALSVWQGRMEWVLASSKWTAMQLEDATRSCLAAATSNWVFPLGFTM